MNQVRPKICGIYRIVSPSGRMYIGQSRDCLTRMQVHRRQLLTGVHHNAILQRAYIKYGLGLVFEVVSEHPSEDLDKVEQSLINTLGDMSYNLSCVIAQGYESDERRATRSNSAKRFWSSPAARAAQSVRSKETAARPEVKAKISASLRRTHQQPDVKAHKLKVAKEVNSRPHVREAIKAHHRDAGTKHRTALLLSLGVDPDDHVHIRKQHNQAIYARRAGVAATPIQHACFKDHTARRLNTKKDAQKKFVLAVRKEK